MLLTSCMRSASTSLIKTLCAATGLPQHIVPSLPGKVPGYEVYPSSTVALVSKDVLADWVCSKEYIIREHLVPIPEHRQIIMSVPEPQRKVVVLKRDWRASFSSQMNRGGKCPYGSRSTNRDDCEKAFKKFREDLEKYFPPSDGFLHVEYDNLTKNPQKYLKEIIEYYQLSYDPSRLILGHYK